MTNKFWDENTLYKAVALFLALILWFIALDQQVPTIEQVYNVPLEVRELPASLVVGELPDHVQIRVEGRKNIIEGAGSRDFDAYLNLSGVESGTHRTDVRVTVPAGLSLVNVTPAEVEVTIEEKRRTELPVTVKITGYAASGYEVMDPFVEPAQVVVEGPQSLLAKAESAYVNVSLSGEEDDYVRVLPIRLSKNELFSEYRLSAHPDTAKVFVPIVPKGNSKEVPITVDLEGQPAEGYEFSAVNIFPESINIYGDSERLSEVEQVSTDPIDISGLKTGMTINTGIKLPQGTKSAMPVGIEVYIEVKKK